MEITYCINIKIHQETHNTECVLLNICEIEFDHYWQTIL